MSLTFLKNYFNLPTQVGAVWPSSQGLCKMLVDGFDWDTVRYAVEYGPGTGVVTPHILKSLHAEGKFFAVERNPEFCKSLRERFPNLDLAEGSVENVVEYCKQRDFPRIDAVICGLPWAAFPEPLQISCMDALMEVLPPGGQFASFAYTHFLFLPAAKRFRRRLDYYFSEVVISPTVWKNLPPALVYRCRR